MKKLSLLLLFLVCIALIFMPACKTAEEEVFNIVGLWSLTLTYSDMEVFITTITFSGSVTAGTAVDGWGGIGTYTVTGTTVNFNIAWSNGNSSNYIGSAPTNNSMNGTFNEASGWTGTWICTR